VPPLTRLELSLPPGVELFASARNIVLAPDGSSVVFVGVLSGSRQLYLRRFDEFEARAVRGTEGATTSFFSADSRSLGFVTFGGLLKTISLTDGLVATLGNDASFLHGGAWAPDGRIVFARNGALWQIDSKGGSATALTELSGKQTRHAWPHVLPDGRTMLFGVQEGDVWRIESMNLDTRARETVVQNGTLPLSVNSGYLVFFREGQLIAAPFDAERVTVTGPTVQLLDGLPALAPGIPLLDVAPTGTVVYAPTTAVNRLVWISRAGDERPLNTEPRIYGSPRVSPDGQRISVQAGDLWLQDLARTTFTRLTTGSIVSNGFPTWTPDGRRLMYRSLQGLRIQDIANPGTGGDIIPGTNEFDYPGSLAPDNDTVVFLRTAADGSLDVMSLSLRDPRKVTSLVATAAYEGGARLSPDGKWLTYVSNETGRNEIYLRQFPGPGERWQVSTAGGTQPVWNPNGKELFYRVDKKLMAVDVAVQPAVVLSPPRQLFEADVLYGAGVTIANYDVSRDGQQFVMVKADPSSGRLNAVLNWFADPARLAPQP
jgi:serine/threonine-protein kinase